MSVTRFLPPGLRSVLSSVRQGAARRLARLLHDGRRRRALARLRRWPVPRHVLVLCLGNICRSPYVEAYLRGRGGDLDLTVSSAGFIGPGRPPPPEAREAAARRSVDNREHVSELVSAAAVEKADLVLLVDPSHRSRLRREAGAVPARVLVLGDLDPEPVDSRVVRDPWGESREVYDQVFRRLDRCLEVLLREWRRRGAE